MKKIIISPKQLNEILCEDYDTKALNKIQKKIYKSVSGFCGKMHSDTGWQDVKKLIGIIDSVDGVDEVYVGAGEYFNYTNPEKGAHRDYDLTVETPFGKLYGYIRCHAAGTTDDIFKYYDMTISLYPDKKRDMEERLGEMNEAELTYVNDMNPSTLINATNNAQENNVTAKLAGGTGPKQFVTLPGLKTGSETVKPNAAAVDIIKDPTKDNQTNGVFESHYSKRQVELGRILEMRKNGRIYSKRQFEKLLK